MNETNSHFHTIIQTSFVSRKFMDKQCDNFISQIAVLLPHISASEPNTLDTLYEIITKKPMSKIEKLDKILIRCQLFLHCTFLNVLNQIEIFANHYQEDKMLMDVLVRKFIKEYVNRLTIIDATFSCMNTLIKHTNETCDTMMENIDSARNEINEQASNGTTATTGILMRLATAVSLSWDLMDSSEEILQNHLDLTKKLSDTHQKTVQLYKLFVEARINTVINMKEFDFKQLTNAITVTLSQ